MNQYLHDRTREIRERLEVTTDQQVREDIEWLLRELAHERYMRAVAEKAIRSTGEAYQHAMDTVLRQAEDALGRAWDQGYDSAYTGTPHWIDRLRDNPHRKGTDGPAGR